MSNTKKVKTIKVRLFSRQSIRKVISPHRKQLKVARKYDEVQVINKSLEKDFLLESGDPREFLKEQKDYMEELGYVKRDSVSRLGSVGSAKLLDMYKERSDLPSAASTKREPLRRRMTIKHAFVQYLDKEILLNTQLEGIRKRINESKVEISEKFKNLTIRDKITYLKQHKSLKKFDCTLKTWKKIEDGLTKKLKKPSKDLISNKNLQIDEKFSRKEASWITRLRENKLSTKLEKFIPVGNKLSGLYLRDVINLNKPKHERTRSCPDLVIEGLSKLPLEVEAIRKPGSRLIGRKENNEVLIEEVFAADYDFNSKFYADF